jgi:hypothetical protein
MRPLCRGEVEPSIPSPPEPWMQGQGTSSGRLPSLPGFHAGWEGLLSSFAECFFLLLASLWPKPSCFPFPKPLVWNPGIWAMVTTS